MAKDDKIAVLYEQFGKDHDLGTIEDFTEAMREGARRVKFFNHFGRTHDLGTFAEFDQLVQDDLKKKNILTVEAGGDPVSFAESSPPEEDLGDPNIITAFKSGFAQRKISEKLGSLSGLIELEANNFQTEEKVPGPANSLIADFSGVSPGIDKDKLIEGILNDIEELESLPKNPILEKVADIAGRDDIGQIDRLQSAIETLLTEGQPVSNVAQLISQSIGSGPEAVLLGTVGAAFGAPGVVLGNFIGSLSAEQANALTGAFLDEGIDISDPQALKNAFTTPEVIERIKEKAQNRALGVATTDAVFSLATPLIARAKINPLVKGISGFGAETIGEGASEIGGQLASGEDINLAEAALESVASAGQSGATTATAQLSKLKNLKGKKDGKETVSENQTEEVDGTGRNDGTKGTNESQDSQEDQGSTEEKPTFSKTQKVEDLNEDQFNAISSKIKEIESKGFKDLTDEQQEELINARTAFNMVRRGDPTPRLVKKSLSDFITKHFDDGKVLSEFEAEEVSVQQETPGSQEDGGSQVDETGENATIQEEQESTKSQIDEESDISPTSVNEEDTGGSGEGISEESGGVDSGGKVPNKSNEDQGVEGQDSDDRIFNNEAILTGNQKEKQSNVNPELSDQGKLDSSISNELTVKEAKRIVKDNDFETVEKTIKDQKNGMNPTLRRVTTLELAKQAKRDGAQDKAVELFDNYAEQGSQGAKAIQAGAIARQDPEVATIELIRNVKESNDKILNTPTGEGKVLGSTISETQAEIQKIAQKEGVAISKSDTLEQAITKIVSKKLTSGEKQKVTKARIRRARDKRARLIEEFKNSPNDLANASLIPGLTPQSVEFIGKIAQTYAEEGIATVELIAAKVQEEIETTFGKKIPVEDIQKALEQQETQKLVDKGIKDLNIEIKDLVKEHFSQKEATNRSLQQKLVEDLGLTDDKAKKLAESVSEEFNSRIREKAQSELDKLFKFANTPRRSQKVKSETDRLIELMNLGALDGNTFNEVIGDRFGLTALNDQDVQQLEALSTAIQTLPEGELRNREIQKFNDHLDKLKGDQNKRKAMADLALEIWYTSVLSGPSTLSRAVKGAGLTASGNLLSAAINNPVATFYGLRGIKHLVRGSKSFGMPGFRQVIRDGFSDIDFFDRQPGKGGRLNEIINTELKELRNQDKGLMKATLKLWMYLPSKMYRGLMATDAVMKHGLKEYEAYIIEYNKLLAEGKHSKFSREFTDELNKRLRLDDTTVEAAKTQAAEEVAALQEEGRSLPEGYESRRVQEIIDQSRDPDTAKRAMMKANEAVLMNEPMGALGSFYRFMSLAGNIKETDSKVEMIGKLFFRSIFPFLRVPTNFINMNLDFTPIGAVRGFRGTRRGPKNEIINMTPEERGRHYARSAIGATTFMGMMMTIFDYDDEEGFKLDENSPIQITGNGKGGYYENLGIDEDFKEFSFRVKMPNGEWSDRFSYIDNPMGMILAPLGFMSDEMRFKDFKKKINENDLNQERRAMGYLSQNGIWMAMNFASSQSYVQGMENLMGIIPSDKGKSSDKSAENLAKLIANPVKGGLAPSLYRQIYGQYKALMDIPQKESTTIPKRIAQDIPLLEQMIENDRYDQFGYPIIKDFNTPLIPDIILKQLKDTRTYRDGKKEWQLIYKFDQVTAGSPFRAPGVIDGKRLTAEQKSEYIRVVGENLRSLVNDDFDYLDDLNAEELQREINRLRQIAVRDARFEITE